MVKSPASDYSWVSVDSTGKSKTFTTATVSAAELGVAGTYTVTLTITGAASSDATKKAKDVSAATTVTTVACNGVATFNSTLSKCTGTLEAVADTATGTLAYAWSYTTASNTTPTTIKPVTKSISATDVNVDGTYTVSVTITGTTGKDVGT